MGWAWEVSCAPMNCAEKRQEGFLKGDFISGSPAAPFRDRESKEAKKSRRGE